ncbi:MAG: TetR/AcrR family transcriptional regulator [Peptostreptococcaceae bacterium]|nr:TetR/AcrR family transcriptional regulator [Peptostreptococcaceae bacterium]
MAAPKNDNIRNRILDVASCMLQEKSFNSISLSQIAKKAEISKGSIYYYYNSKDDLLYDIADIYLSQLYSDLLIWVDNKEKDTSLPRLLYFSLHGGIEEPEKNLRLHLVMDAIAGNVEITEKLNKKYKEFKDIFSAKIMERMATPDSKKASYYGWLLLTIIDGVVIQNLLGNKELINEDFINMTVDLIEKN